MDYLIGNKESFAVEFNVQVERFSHHLFGGLRIWLEGKYIGAYQDINILSVTLCQLEKLLTERNIHSNGFEHMDDKDIFCYIKSEDNLDDGRYFFSPGEAFDDFSIVVYKFNGVIKFIWKLNEPSIFQYINYPRKIQSAEVGENEFSEVMAKFRIKLDELSKIIPIIEP